MRKGAPSNQRLILLCRNLPAPVAVALQQEHVVNVEVRADPAAFGCIAHHQIV